MTDQAETDLQNETDVEGAGKENSADGGDLDLDALLSQGSEARQDPPKPDEPKKPDGTVTVPADEWNAIKSTVDALRSQKVGDDIDRGLKEAVSSMKEYSESLEAVDDSVLRTQLRGMADEDHRIAEAFMDRHNNPDRWKSIVNAAAKELGGKLGGRRTTPAERQAAEAAGRHVSDQPSGDSDDNLPPQSEIARMTPFQYQKMMRERGMS